VQRGRPRNFDKAEALDAALELFWKHGYEGTSMAMLTESIGVNVASLYAAFGNKERLFVQCVERYSELNGDLYHESLKKKTARDVAHSILEGEVELVTARHARRVSMIQGTDTSPARGKDPAKYGPDARYGGKVDGRSVSTSR
jgi:AcrR family transcriptional regulator